MKPTVRRLGEADEAQYEAFMSMRPERMIYYDWRFRRFLLDILTCEATYLGAFGSTGELRGIFPLMARDGEFGRVWNSLPFFGSNGGPVGDADANEALWAAFFDLIESDGTAAAAVVAHPLYPAAVPRAPDFEDSRIGQFTSLADERGVALDLSARIESTARRNISAAARAGVSIEVDNGELAALEEIHQENILAIGGTIKRSVFFEKLAQHLRPNVDWRLYVARSGATAKVIGCLLLFYSGGVVDYYIPGTRLADRSLQPSAALIHQAMTDAQAEGYRTWNWGGTWPTQEGVLRFKRKWAAVDRPYRYWVRVRDKRLLASNPAKLLAAYPNFYVVPFGALS
jgi:hypothetical protein